METTITCDEFKKQAFSDVHPMIHTLLSMDSRIRLYPIYGDVDEKKGFFVTKRHIYIPHLLPTVQHDISHLLELRNSARWTMPDWGMPRYDGDDVSPKRLFSALSRETRTRAIQLHLTIFRSNEEKRASTAYSQLNNKYWDEMCRKNLPFGRFKTYQDLNAWMCTLRERTFKAWSLDRIYHEWTIRLNHIQHWMETLNSNEISG